MMLSESQVMGYRATEEPRFLVDVNVGRLAKWLRVLGYDTLFPAHEEDNELIRIGLRDSRIILTRDSGFMQRWVVTTGRLKVLLIRDDDLRSQFRQVVQYFNLSNRNGFSRCIRCNELLIDFSRELAKEQVPPYVYRTQQEFMRYPICQRVYWRGTHWANMDKELTQLQACPERSRRACS